MKDTDYLSISSRVRAMENRLLTRERRERMLDARSDEEAAKILTECGYAEPEDLSAAGVNAVLTRARTELFEDLAKSVPEKSLVQVFQIKYDYHNAKAILKAEAMGEDSRRLLMAGGRYDPDTLADLLRRGESREFSPLFAHAVEEARRALTDHHDPQRADLVLDRACYEEMGVQAKKSGSAFLQGYVRLAVDGVNLRTRVRCERLGVNSELMKASLLPGGNVPAAEVWSRKAGELPNLFSSTPLAGAAQLGGALLGSEGGSLTAFERACDNALTAYLTQAKRIPFGEQPVVSYLCVREAEATAIRTILSGRKAGLSADAIRERLRECYV